MSDNLKLPEELQDKAFILYSKRSHVTGRKLKEVLGIRGGRKLSYRDAKQYPVVLRWGSSASPMLEEFTNVINPHNSVKRSLDRRAMFQRANATTKVPACGRLGTTRLASVLGNAEFEGTRFPYVVIRPRAGESPWGRDIIFAKAVQNSFDGWQWEPESDNLVNKMIENRGPYSDIITQYIPALYEVRVHVTRGTSRLFQVKYHDEHGYGADLLREGKPFIRSHENGWKLLPLSSTKARELGIDKERVRNRAKSVARVFGLDIAAVDFMLFKHREDDSEHEDYFLEINTAPGLEDYSIDMIVPGIRDLLIDRISDEFTVPPPVEESDDEESDDVPFSDFGAYASANTERINLSELVSQLYDRQPDGNNRF